MRTSRQDWFGLGLPRVHFGQVWASLSLLLVGWGGVGWWGVGWDGGGMGGMVGGWVGWWGSGGPTPLLKILEPMLTPRSLHLEPWISFPAL